MTGSTGSGPAPREGAGGDAGQSSRDGGDAAGDQPNIADYAAALADGIDAVLATWVVGCVTRLMWAWSGTVPPDVLLAAEEAGQRCRDETGAQIRALLEADIDAQRGTPLALLRRAVRYPTEVLAAAGVPHVVRDAFVERAFPDDPYGLAPASLADLDPSLSEPGIAWGAAKAFEHMHRHRR
jgi:hypothetical protein